jgi:hypothetical protein
MFDGRDVGKSHSMKAHLHIDVTQVSGSDDLHSPDSHLYDWAVEICIPPFAESAQARIRQLRIIMPLVDILPEKRLNQRRMVRHAIENFGGCLSPADQLANKVMTVH